MILATAGHVDHGKTALVRALTGVDTDRLPEERRRGMTIELGFAPLQLGAHGTAAIVDVPGHERFVRTMIAGAGGVDAALLVVAADDGPMPQTGEHLCVLTALGVTRGVVALTKCDLVDSEWVDLVAADVQELLLDSSLAGASVIPVSAVSGTGLDALRSELARLAAAVPPRSANDLFRLVVDRSFALRGIGTVVTGTVWTGSVAAGALVSALPGGASSRVRGVQVFGAGAECATAGSRAALALPDVSPADAPRGSTLVSDPAWHASRVLWAELDTAAVAARHRTVAVSLGGAACGARVSRVAPVPAAGGRPAVVARLRLDRPVVARAGDRLVLRSTSPQATLGGGTVLDPLPPRRASALGPGTPLDRLDQLLVAAGSIGVETAELLIRIPLRPDEVVRMLAAAGAVTIGTRAVSRDALQAAAGRIAAAVEEFHSRSPLEPGLPLATARRAARAPDAVADAAIGLLCGGPVEDGHVVEHGTIRAARHAGGNAHAAELLARLLQRLERAGAEPPTVAELAGELGEATPALLRHAERLGNIVAVDGVRYYEAGVAAALVRRVQSALRPGEEYAPADFRAVLGVSRKYLIPFLEYLDRLGVTERRPGGRVLREVSSP